MNELNTSEETNRPAAQRPPVIWRIASVIQEHESVTIVFPVANEIQEKYEQKDAAGNA